MNAKSPQLRTKSKPDVEMMTASKNDIKFTHTEIGDIEHENSKKTIVKDNGLTDANLNGIEEEKKSLQQNYENVVSQMQSKTIARDSKTTSIKDFSTLKVLGIGTYGKVLLVLHKET